MSILLHLEIAGLPPSVNSMYRTGKFGTRYKKAEVQEWQDEIAEAVRRKWENLRPYTGAVEVHVLFTVKSKRRWDIDNRLKSLLDCLQKGGAIKDDTQIWGILALREEGEESKTEIEMREYTGYTRKREKRG